MKKHELQEKLRSRGQRDKLARKQEGAIIMHLPDDVEVARLQVGFAHTLKRANAHGFVEFECENYDDVLALMRHPKFRPAPMMRVLMARENVASKPTISFYPAGLIPLIWYNEHSIAEAYPALFQMQVGPGGDWKRDVRVYIEWFVDVGQGFYANIRAFVKNHPCKFGYSTGEGGRKTFFAENVPRGEVRKVQMGHDGGPPYVTVWWWPTMVSGDVSATTDPGDYDADRMGLRQLLAEAEVAHV